MTTKSRTMAGLTLVCLELLAQGQVAINSPSTEWVPLLYGGSVVPDPATDQQTGGAEADIVGNATHPSLYMRYAPDAGGSPTAGWLAFRMRLGGDINPPGFKSVGFVGLDADLNGSLDLFLGASGQGSISEVAIWNPGSGANTSPRTTTIVTPPLRSYAQGSDNYSFAPVSTTIDPAAVNLDLDSGGKTDYLLSFSLPFSEVVALLNQRGISGFTKDSPMRFVAATASQQNSLNQDLNGILGSVNATQTREALGGFTRIYSAVALQPVPEPAAARVFIAGLALLAFRTSIRSRSNSRSW